jgi:hypothetical protein
VADGADEPPLQIDDLLRAAEEREKDLVGQRLRLRGRDAESPDRQTDQEVEILTVNDLEVAVGDDGFRGQEIHWTRIVTLSQNAR